MGNCQAVDAAVLVIQHPNGRIERMYWQVSASEVMKMNPGHYVALIIPLPVINDGNKKEDKSDDHKTIRFTRVKLLKATDTLVLGRAYRLVTTQEVVKVLRAKKQAKVKKNILAESDDEMLQTGVMKQSSSRNKVETRKCQVEENSQVRRHERINRQNHGSTDAVIARPKQWRPSLQSISETLQ